MLFDVVTCHECKFVTNDLGMMRCPKDGSVMAEHSMTAEMIAQRFHAHKTAARYNTRLAAWDAAHATPYPDGR
jgi:hypothetical protein